jgi:hypothetical protein
VFQIAAEILNVVGDVAAAVYSPRQWLVQRWRNASAHRDEAAHSPGSFMGAVMTLIGLGATTRSAATDYAARSPDAGALTEERPGRRSRCEDAALTA